MANILNFRDQVKFGTGDTIKVHQKVTEGEKTRNQIFEGVVIRIKGHDGLKSFTVRKIASNGVGVERIYPEASPTVAKIEVVKRGKVRRAVLSYLRDRVGRKATKIKDSYVKAEVSEDTTEEMTEEQKKIAKKVKKMERVQKVEKKKAGKVKEKKKTKKKAKVQRKEKVFVR